MKNQRQVSIELLRIICLFMIVFSHATQYLYGGSWWEVYQTNLSLNLFVTMILGIWGQVSVATFVVISCYFHIDKQKINSKKIVKLIFQTILLTLFCYIITLILTKNFSIKTLIFVLYNSILSPFNGSYWFITTYLFFYMLFPLMHFLTDKISKESLKHICVVLIFMVFGIALFQKSAGGTLLEFCSLYFIVAYLKKYKEQNMKNNCKKYFILGLTILIIFCFGLKILSVLFDSPILYNIIFNIFVNWNPILIMTSISLFYYFKYHIHIKSAVLSKFITNISKTTIGIYILHENGILGKSIIWHKWLKLDVVFRKNQFFYIYFIGSVLIVFIICTIIEMIRMKLIDEYFFKKHTKKLDDLCGKFDNYYLCVIDNKQE